ncbi:MAG: nicotinate-nucleotide adenylyltransferase [Solirubrobacterales bacterium]|nr:nicotinate-nucleotide adenylyltransferase [Solirubrobacterales bacterium]
MLAQEAAAQLGLDAVLLVPAGEAPHKRIDPEPGRDVRLEMAQRAAAGDALLAASAVEVERDGPSFTHETLEVLRAERPDDELWFLMGADVAAGLERWRNPARVVELARLGIAARAGTGLDEAEAALEALGAEDRFEVVRMPEIGVSSTRVRRRVAQGRPIRYLVPDAVVDVIESRGLYR